MSSPRIRIETLNRTGPRPVRLVALLVISILLHLLMLSWASGSLGLPSFPDRPDHPLPAVTTVTLAAPEVETPAPVAAPVKPAPKPRPKPKPKARPETKPPAASLPAPPIEPPVQIAPQAEPVAALPLAGMEAPGTSVEEADMVPEVVDTSEPGSTSGPIDMIADAANPPDSGELLSDTVAAHQPHYKVNPPPSAELEYDVQAMRKGQEWYGTGLFRWEAAGDRYTLTGEASISFLFKITVLNFKSEGAINALGIAPDLYSEKPWRKALTNTHFQRESKSISFSASTATYPYEGGEQDRASIMWQLAGIGRGDPSQYAAGTVFNIVVAGARDAEAWGIEVIGQEEIDTPAGKMMAWRVVRAPREGSYDQKIEIWLAPEREWYPVKVRYTYANGDHLDMSLTSVTAPPAH